MRERSQSLEFLYKAVEDIQGTIRFLDTKAAFGIAILGAVVAQLLDSHLLTEYRSHGVVLCVLVPLLTAAIALSAVAGFLTVFPLINPSEHVWFPDNLEPRFFIAELTPRSFWRLFSGRSRFCRLRMTHPEYCAALERADSRHFESVMAAEVLKLSFIRQLKTDRLQWFAKCLIITVILFLCIALLGPKAEPSKQVIVLQTQPVSTRAPYPENQPKPASKEHHPGPALRQH